MHCRPTYSIEETKELSLSLYSDSIGVNKGKRPSLYSDKHGGVKVKELKVPKVAYLEMGGSNVFLYRN